MPLLFFKRSDLGVPLLIFAKEREGSGTLKKTGALNTLIEYYIFTPIVFLEFFKVGKILTLIGMAFE